MTRMIIRIMWRWQRQERWRRRGVYGWIRGCHSTTTTTRTATRSSGVEGGHTRVCQGVVMVVMVLVVHRTRGGGRGGGGVRVWRRRRRRWYSGRGRGIERGIVRISRQSGGMRQHRQWRITRRRCGSREVPKYRYRRTCHTGSGAATRTRVIITIHHHHL